MTQINRVKTNNMDHEFPVSVNDIHKNNSFVMPIHFVKIKHRFIPFHILYHLL